MRPFKMFFGMSLAIMLFFFVAKFFVFAFIAAAIMSVIYAVFRRLKDFITYDRFGEYYVKGYDSNYRLNSNWDQEAEPLFHGSRASKSYREVPDIHFIDIK
jgi:hypothetical protein